MPWLTAVLAGLLIPAMQPAAAAAPRSDGGFDAALMRFRGSADPALACDAIHLANGTMRSGKALEWGTDVVLFDSAGHVDVLPAGRFTRIDFAPDASPTTKNGRPGKPDLTVAFVRRLPDAASDARPRFLVTVRSVGGVLAKPFAYRALIDGNEIASGECPKTLVVQQDWTFEVAVPGPADPGELRIELDTRGDNDEISEGNNVFTEPIDALPIEVVLPAAFAERLNRTRNMLDTYNAEDWAQHHVRCLNRLFAQSVHPASPLGIAGRLRVDRISVADSTADTSAPPASADAGAVRLTWRVRPPELDDPAAARRVDWSALKEICLDLGLPDLRGCDMRPQQCLVRDASDRFLQIGHHLPQARILTYQPGPFALCESDAAFLNETFGRPRSAAGDPRYRLPRLCILEVRDNIGRPLDGVRVEIMQRAAEGEFRGCMPAEPIIVGNTEGGGRLPLPNRSVAGPNGVIPVGAADNPWGHLDAEGLSALWLVRLTHQNAVEHHFVRMLDFNTARARGQRDEHVLPMLTRFPSGGPEPNDYTRLYFEDYLRPDQVEFRWPHWGKSAAAPPVREYRVYQRTGHGGDQDQAWRQVDVVQPNPPAPPPHPHRSVRTFYAPLGSDGTDARDTWFAMAGVTPGGLEGRLSYPLYLPDVREMLRCAMDASQVIYIPVGASGTSPLLMSDLMRAGYPLRPYGLRVTRPEFTGYEPAAHGAAIARDGRLILADAVNHQVAWYERGELVMLVGGASRDAAAAASGPAEFNQPSDVAVDEKGRVYVADRLNHRVVILSADGAPVGILDSDGEPPHEPAPASRPGGRRRGGKRGRVAASQNAGAATDDAASNRPASRPATKPQDRRFDQPIAVGCLTGCLTVTDAGRKRVSVFDVSSDAPPTFIRSIGGLRDPDRALVSPTRRLYVCDQDADGKWCVNVYSSTVDKVERVVHATMQGYLNRPRGLCYDGRKFAYVVNQFPFRVASLQLE